MRASVAWAFATALHTTCSLASQFESALDMIVDYHGQDVRALSYTLDSLKHIASRLNEEPNNPKYHNIRLLNKTFWERVGRVDGGISFMSALGFELVQQDEGRGPSFQKRRGHPDRSDLRRALQLLSAREGSSNGVRECGKFQGNGGYAGPLATEAREPRSGQAFDPFATAFSRKTRTRVQERAEQGLVSLEQSQARLRQHFAELEERNVTILLPHTKISGDTAAPEGAFTGADDDSEVHQRDLELVAQLWRERMTKEDTHNFETRAVKEFRMLRSSKVYPYVLIRVRMPGGLYLQARFNPDETLEDVYGVIGASLQAEAGGIYADQGWLLDFELFMAPPTRVLPRSSISLKDAKIIAPACLLHLRWDSEDPGPRRQARDLEERMSVVSCDSPHPRLSYASRYDVPETVSPSSQLHGSAEKRPGIIASAQSPNGLGESLE